jgi:hypothetical protein
MLNQEQLKQILSYDSESGQFTWLITQGKAVEGEIAGCKMSIGYTVIGFGGRNYRAHRLAWLYMYGQWPEKHIDHANGIKDDNRIANLRQATQVENLYNKGANKNSKTGIKGVCWEPQTGKYQVKITKNGKQMHIGRYKCQDEAAAAYAEAAIRLHGEFARTA